MRRLIDTDKRRPMPAIPSMLQRLNVRQVLEVMMELGPCTRTVLRKRTGLSAPTVSKLVDALLETGLIEEEAEVMATGGRPSKVYRPARHAVQVIGVVVDIRRCDVVSTGIDGAIEPDRSVSFRTPRSYEALVATLKETVDGLRRKSEGTCLGMGVTMPGLINRKTGEVVFSPNLHCVDGKRPHADLADATGLDVMMFQEEHALCMGEQMFGTARGVEDFAMVDISAGLGLGVVSGGKYVHGHTGYGGELGHIVVVPGGEPCGCGNRGCLETVATDRTLVRTLSKRLASELDADDVVALIRSGEVDADAECSQIVRYLASGIAMIINILNPAYVFVLGRLFDAKPGLFEELKAHVRKCSLAPALDECRLVRATGNKARGAVAGLINHHLSTVGPRISAT